MKRVVLILLAISLIMGCRAAEKGEKKVTPKREKPSVVEEEAPPKPTPEAKKILMIIAHKDFRDEEYKQPRDLFEEEGFDVTVASSSLEEAKGMLGMEVKPDILLDQVNVEDYDAIVFVGGSGASEYWDNSTAHTIAQKAVEANKILAAICIAPVTLANAGVLSGKKATVYSSRIGEIQAKGAKYEETDVIRDGNIITASGPQASRAFARAIVEALKES
ncbi:MAG: DJ-1/PfpI family protein [Actinomycetota bacterium]|nr:DJ-1/PfpI family protein [Actinomycetota bacterium]